MAMKMISQDLASIDDHLVTSIVSQGVINELQAVNIADQDAHRAGATVPQAHHFLPKLSGSST
jgi:hypothetical protein